MFQRPGSGFLGSALTTAAGVAGGLVAGNALMNLFSGSHSGGFGGGMGGGFTPGAPMAGSPWGSPPADQGYVDQGTWTDNSGGGQADPGLCRQRLVGHFGRRPIVVAGRQRGYRLGQQRRRVERRYVLT